MKLVFCLECGDIFSPGVNKTKRCECGYSLARWEDPRVGTLRVASRLFPDGIRVLGISNSWIRCAQILDNDDEPSRHIDTARECCESAEGYLFKTRECPIVMTKAPHVEVKYDPSLLEDVPWHGKYDCALNGISDVNLGARR